MIAIFEQLTIFPSLSVFTFFNRMILGLLQKRTLHPLRIHLSVCLSFIYILLVVVILQFVLIRALLHSNKPRSSKLQCAHRRCLRSRPVPAFCGSVFEPAFPFFLAFIFFFFAEIGFIDVLMFYRNGKL